MSVRTPAASDVVPSPGGGPPYSVGVRPTFPRAIAPTEQGYDTPTSYWQMRAWAAHELRALGPEQPAHWYDAAIVLAFRPATEQVGRALYVIETNLVNRAVQDIYDTDGE